MTQQSEQINELAEALAKAQGQMQNAKKDSTNPHFKSNYRNNVDHKLRMFSNLIFVDFGCGPLTSGISLAWYNLVVNKHPANAVAPGLRLHYIGMDRSQPMLAHAQAASVSSGLFHSKSTFDFISRANLPIMLPALIEKYRAANGNKQLTVVLNCSYYFGSRTLDVSSLVKIIKTLLQKHVPQDKVCLTYQNASHTDVNTKWEAFKKGVHGHLIEKDSANEYLQYYDVTGRRTQPNPQPIRLRRELLLNSTWKDLLEKDKK